MKRPELPAWPDAYMSRLNPADIVQRRENISVGSVAFTFDRERRVYGPSGGGPNTLHMFRPARIIGETKASWLTGPDWRPTKHAKRPREGMGGLYGLDDVHDAVFVEDHGWHIGDAVRTLRDADTLRKIAALAGYKLPA